MAAASNSVRAKALAAVVGAAVGDAAATGSHWIYGKTEAGLSNVEDRLGPAPAFAPIEKANFVGPAYFAHGRKAVGEPTHLGEAMQVVLRGLSSAAADGASGAEVFARPGAWRAAFKDAYDYGGTWVGYVDHATRDTLANLDGAVDAAAAAVGASSELVKAAQALGGAAAPALGTPGYAEALAAKAEGDVAPAAAAALAEALAAPVGSAKDNQTNALAKAIPLAALATGAGLAGPAWDGALAAAVRDTQNNDESVLAVSALAAVLSGVVEGLDIEAAVGVGQARLAAAAAEAASEDSTEAAYAAAGARAIALAESGASALAVGHDEWGSSCPLPNTVPCLFHLLLTASSFSDAVTTALLVGGDSAPRAAFAGAVFAARDGLASIPPAWRSLASALVAETQAHVDAILPSS